MLLESQHAEKQIVFTRLFCLPVSVGAFRATTARKRVKRKKVLSWREGRTDCSSRISRLVLLQKNSGRVPEVGEGTAADLI